jgi:hypothetical protein
MQAMLDDEKLKTIRMLAMLDDENLRALKVKVEMGALLDTHADAQRNRANTLFGHKRKPYSKKTDNGVTVRAGRSTMRCTATLTQSCLRSSATSSHTGTCSATESVQRRWREGGGRGDAEHHKILRPSGEGLDGGSGTRGRRTTRRWHRKVCRVLSFFVRSM